MIDANAGSDPGHCGREFVAVREGRGHPGSQPRNQVFMLLSFCLFFSVSLLIIIGSLSVVHLVCWPS